MTPAFRWSKGPERLLVKADAAFPLGIALTELVRNAAKYAFPAPSSGTILAQAQRSRPGWVEVLIRDNGVGMSNFREGSCALASFAHGFNKSGARSTFGALGGVTVTISFPQRLESLPIRSSTSTD